MVISSEFDTVESAAGVGRSRLLNAFVLEGKLAGALVIVAGAADARKGDYGVIRTLIEDLLVAAPAETLAEAEKDGAIFGHISPELHEKLGSPQLLPLVDPLQQRARIQAALHSLFTSYCTNRRVMIAVDNIHSCDELSMAVLASLSRSAHRLKLILAVTVETKAGSFSSEAVRMIKDAGTLKEASRLRSTAAARQGNIALGSHHRARDVGVVKSAGKGLVSDRSRARPLLDAEDALR